MGQGTLGRNGSTQRHRAGEHISTEAKSQQTGGMGGGVEGRACCAHRTSVCLEEELGFYPEGDRKPPTNLLKISLMRCNLHTTTFARVM